MPAARFIGDDVDGRKAGLKPIVLSPARDVRSALRALLASPALTVLAVVTLGLGIGASTAMFSVLDRLLIRPPASVTEPSQVVRFEVDAPMPGGSSSPVPILTYTRYVSLRRRARAFSAVGAFSSDALTVAFGTGERALPVRARLVTSSFFAVLGVQPIIGRFFLPTRFDNDRDRAAPEIVLSSEFWNRQFGSARDVLGSTVTVGGETYTIVGVAPHAFSGVDVDVPDIWIPIEAAAPSFFGPGALEPNAAWLEVIGRMRAGVTRPQASREATAILRVDMTTGRIDPTVRASLGSLRDITGESAGSAERLAEWLAAACGVVFLIACANVAGLLAARTAQRRRDTAVRLALGARRADICWQVLIECLCLALLGGATGTLITFWVSSALRAFFLPHADRGPIVDGRVAAFTIASVLVATILAGLAPAIASADLDLAAELKLAGNGRSTIGSRKRSALIAVQVALTVSLLATAGLFIESLRRAGQVQLGFDSARLLSVSVDLYPPHYTPSAVHDAYTNLQNEVDALPGIASASLVAGTQFGRGVGVQLTLPGRGSTPGLDTGGPLLSAVTPDYFRTVGQGIGRGRSLTVDDRAESQRVAVVDETLAALYWPGENPIGKCFKILDESACTEVVGVTRDAHVYGLIERPHLQFYIPLAQLDSAGVVRWPVVAVLVRTTGAAAEMVHNVQHAIVTGSTGLPYPKVAVVGDRFDRSLREWRLGSALLLVLGGVGLLLAAVGLHGLLRYLVTRRMRELAIRISLGADPRRLVWRVVGDGLRITIPGLVVGAACAVAVGHATAAFLYGVSAVDTASLLGTTIVLLLATGAATYIPARRAASIDPVAVLRSE